MPSTDHLNTDLLTYFPNILVQSLSESSTDQAASSAQYYGAVMLIDISGFTQLTNQLADHGSQGAEYLTTVLNDFFGQLIHLIQVHQGDVVKFAGDALLASWATESSQYLGEMVLKAIEAGSAIKESMSNFTASVLIDNSEQAFKLDSSIAIGTGTLYLVNLGGVFNRWEFIVSGSALVEVGEASNIAKKGQLVLTKSALSSIDSFSDAFSIKTKSIDDHHLLVKQIKVKKTINTNYQLPLANQKALPALKNYLPRAILHRIEAGHTAWLGEMRWATTLFINLPKLSYRDGIDIAQNIMQALQKAVYRYEGSINKISVDDKGISILAAFGLPPLAHEDDAQRGVQSAIYIEQSLQELGVDYAIGVATGRVYCGIVGNQKRREYTVMGNHVNLSARLMQHAQGTVLVDDNTFQQSKDLIEYKSSHTLNLKGFEENQLAHRPDRVIDCSLLNTKRTALVGRAQELESLTKSIDAFVDNKNTNTILIEGEPGVGKSRLLDALLDTINEIKLVKLISVATDAIEWRSAYFIWKKIFNILFVNALSENNLETTLTEIISDEEEDFSRFLPLLNGILGCNFKENTTTQSMGADIKPNVTLSLLVKIIAKLAAQQPILLVIDDAHWQDSSSWRLISHVLSNVQSIMIVMFSRPLDPQQVPPDVDQIKNLACFQSKQLANMVPEEVVQLVKVELDVDFLPKEIEQFIIERGEGNPFFSIEIAYALKEQGFIEIHDRACHLAADIKDIDSIERFNSIQSVITSRIDRLNPQQQLIVKVASVIGRVFALQLLKDIYPIDQDKDSIELELDYLQEVNLTNQETPAPDIAYAYRHIITQQVAYELLLQSQRQSLHEALAKSIESRYQDQLDNYYVLLAHHWGKTNYSNKAINYLEAAAHKALANFSTKEAITLITEAIYLNDSKKLVDDPVRLSRWDILLGVAHYMQGKLDDAKEYLQSGLLRLGGRIPTTRHQFLMDFTKHSIRQFKTRVYQSLGFTTIRRNADPSLLLQIAMLCGKLFPVYYFKGEGKNLFISTMQGINAIEASGHVNKDLYRLYANFTMILGLIPWHKQALFYRQRTLTLAKQIDCMETRSWVGVIIAVYDIGSGNFQQAKDFLLESIQLSKQLGDKRRMGGAMANLVNLDFLQADCEKALANANFLYNVTVKGNDIQSYGWALVFQARCLYRRQEWALLSTTLEKLTGLINKHGSLVDNFAQFDCFCLNALMAFQKNSDDSIIEAEQYVSQALAVIKRMGRPTQCHMCVGCDFLALAAIKLWLHRPQNRKYRQWVKECLKIVTMFSRVFSITTVYLWQYEAQVLQHLGKHAEAEEKFTQCKLLAEQYGMRYESARADLYLSNLTSTSKDMAIGELSDMGLPIPIECNQ